LTAERALMILGPRLVVSQNVLSFSTSPSGRYLVAVQEVPSDRPFEYRTRPPEPEAKRLVVWDSTAGTVRSVALPLDVVLQTATIEWFPQTEIALVRTMRLSGATTTYEWHLLDSASTTMRQVSVKEGPYSPPSRFAVSFTTPIAVRIEQSNNRSDLASESTILLQTLLPDGTLGAAKSLPKGLTGVERIGWSPDGKTLQIEATRVSPDNTNPTPIVIRFDPITYSFTEGVGPVSSYGANVREPDFQLSLETIPIGSDDNKRTLTSWWVRSKAETSQPRALVAEHATIAGTSRGEQYFAFIANGALFTRQIVPLTLEQYEREKLAEERTRLIRNASKLAKGFEQYASDRDGDIPSDFHVTDLEPYLIDRSLINGFVMVFIGRDLYALKEPHLTEVGYYVAPGGRVVVYADGHVKWQKSGG
jgi:hypothetical protein